MVREGINAQWVCPVQNIAGIISAALLEQCEIIYVASVGIDVQM